MRPTAEQALQGIRDYLLSTIAPAVGDPFLRGQVQNMAMHIDGIAAGWDGEAGGLRAGNETMAALLGRGAAALADGDQQHGSTGLGRHSDATPIAETPVAALSSLYARQDQLSAALSEILVALERMAAHAPTPEALALRRDIYAFLRDQITNT
jgi:hypothetical protein